MNGLVTSILLWWFRFNFMHVIYSFYPLLQQFNELQECYLQKRRIWNGQSDKQEERDPNTLSREGYNPSLDDFQSVLSTFTRYRYQHFVALILVFVFISLLGNIIFLSCLYHLFVAWYSRLRVVAELRHGDLFHAANIVSR